MEKRTRERASALCVVDGNALLVGLREPASGALLWFPPGGAVEPGETEANAAERETLEETGYRVRCVGAAHELRYPFLWNGVSVDCRTAFFDAELLSEAAAPGAPADPMVRAVRWVPVDELARHFTYPDPLRAFLLERYAALARSRKLNR